MINKPGGWRTNELVKMNTRRCFSKASNPSVRLSVAPKLFVSETERSSSGWYDHVRLKLASRESDPVNRRASQRALPPAGGRSAGTALAQTNSWREASCLNMNCCHVTTGSCYPAAGVKNISDDLKSLSADFLFLIVCNQRTLGASAAETGERWA